MTLPVLFAGVEVPALGTPELSAVRFEGMPLFYQLRKGWSSIALGIILAGGVYPIVLALIAALVGVILDPPSIPELIGTVVILTIYALISAVIGLIWTNVVVVATLPAMLLVVWSLGMRGSLIWFGAFWGGLVGFAAVLPFLLVLPVADELIVSLAVGPALTTVLGQLGGAWGGRRATRRIDWYQRALAQASVIDAAEASEPAECKHGGDDVWAKPVWFQFGIRHLMWAAVWLSVLLSLIRLLGLPFEFILPLLGGWLGYQAATLWLGGMLARRLGPWWAACGEIVPRGTTVRADAACAFHVEHMVGRSLPVDVTREVVSRETGEAPEGLGTGG